MRDLGQPASFKKLWNALKELSKRVDEMRIVPTPNLRISRTSMGQRVEVMPSGKTTTSARMVFRGEWTETYYSVGDVVVVYAGQSQGTYICIKDHHSGRAIQNGSEISYIGIHPVPYSTDYESVDSNSNGNLYWVEFTYRQAKAVNW